jgi:hypothetical protein
LAINFHHHRIVPPRVMTPQIKPGLYNANGTRHTLLIYIDSVFTFRFVKWKLFGNANNHKKKFAKKRKIKQTIKIPK